MKNKICFLILTMTFLCVMVFFVRADETPVDIFIMVNLSNEMSENDPDKIALHGISHFIGTLGVSESRVCVLGYNERVVQIPLQRLESEYVISDMQNAVSSFEYSGNKNEFVNALNTAVRTFAGGRQEPVFIVITTHDDTPRSSELARRNIPLHIININSITDANNLSATISNILYSHRFAINNHGATPMPTPVPVDEIFEEEIFEEEVFEEESEEEIFEEEVFEEEIFEEEEYAEEEPKEEEPEEEVFEEEEPEEEETSYALLIFLAIISGMVAFITVIRFIRMVIS